MRKKLKVCIITGSRAEWGLFYPLAKQIKRNNKYFHLYIIAIGTHLLKEYGLTYREIEKDGFEIAKKVKIYLSKDDDKSIAKYIGSAIRYLTDDLKKIKPDLVFLLGDRFETFAAAVASFVLKIPIAHIHGGEVTEAAIDDALRHSITKMASLHFVSTQTYRKRVIQMGEEPNRVFNVGALGIDNVNDNNLLDRRSFEEAIGFKLARRNILVTFHPLTLEDRLTTETQFKNLLKAIDQLEDTKIIFTHPNADMYSDSINRLIKSYVAKNKDRVKYLVSMGRVPYLSALQFVDIVIGNSSSGIIEVPFFGIPTINIGDRQKGRLRPDSVIDVDGSFNSIKDALKKAFSKNFRRLCNGVENPYGNGNSSKKIINAIKEMPKISPRKIFFNIEYETH